MTPRPQARPRITVLLIVAMVLMPLLGVDLQLPAMPIFGGELSAATTLTQITLSVFAATFAVMHLILGPIADRFGRKPVLLCGLALFALGSAAAALAPSIEVLIGARVLQGVGAASGPLLGRAIVRDLYGAERSGRIMGYLMACFGIGAITTPLIGGVLVEAVGWRATFWFAGCYAAVLLAASTMYLPESMPRPDPAAVVAGRRAGNYLTLLFDIRFILVTVCGCLVQSSMFAWISGSSFVVQQVLGYGPTAYALIYGGTVTTFVVTSLVSARLAPRLGSYRLLAFGVAIAASGGLLGLVLGLSVPITLAVLLVPIMLMTCGHGITLPQSMAASVVPFPLMAATASALYGFVQYGSASLVSVANGVLFDGTAVPMLAIIAGFTVAATLLYFMFYGRLLRAAAARAGT